MVGFLKVYGYQDKKAKIGWNIASKQNPPSTSFSVGIVLEIILNVLVLMAWFNSYSPATHIFVFKHRDHNRRCSNPPLGP